MFLRSNKEAVLKNSTERGPKLHPDNNGKLLAIDVEDKISFLLQAISDQERILKKIAKIRKIKDLSELEFAKLCGEIDCIIEEYSAIPNRINERRRKKCNVVEFSLKKTK